MKKALLLLCFALGLTDAANANRAQEILVEMSPEEQAIQFKRALEATNIPCATATNPFYQGSGANGDAFWNVSCTDGQSYVVQIDNDAGGSVTVLSCAVLEAVGGGVCFQKFRK